MSETTYWDKPIAVERINGVPYRLYTNRPHSIAELLPFAAHWHDRPFILHGDRVLTFANLLTAIAAKAQTLIAAGVTPGDRVAILGWNSPDWVINFWACLRIGAVPVLGNAWWGEAELNDALTLVQPVLTLADGQATARLPPNTRTAPWETPETPQPSTPPTPPATHENNPAIIIFTSGTQGRAKAVVLPHRAFIASMMMILHVTRQLPYRINPAAGETSLHTGPLFHIGGAHALIRSVVSGNTLVMLTGRFDPGEILALIERHRIVRWNAVPTMATRLLEHPDLKTRDISSLTSMSLGGAPVHAELLARIREHMPAVQARIATGYGLSENAGQATAASGADTTARPGASGRPLPCAEITIAPRQAHHPIGLPSRSDKDARQNSESLADGEILIRSPTQMLGYFGETEQPIDAEGWLHTGDLGHLDAEGHLWITGRSKDIIIRGGENIAPASVERALMAIDGVVEAVVFAVPDPELGEDVMAVVVTDRPLTPTDLTTHLRGKLASFAIPRHWRLQTEPLPVNQTGKIDKPAVIAKVRAES